MNANDVLTKLKAEIELLLKRNEPYCGNAVADGQRQALYQMKDIITSIQQEQPEVDMEKLKNKAELIANEIMIGVQANKYHTCIYNKTSNDFNHSHLFRAALKGIEVGINARKEE